MRCSGWSSLAISASSALAALVLAAPAAAHVTASPAFLPAGGEATLTLSVPNERDEPMTELAVTAPPGVRLVRAHPAGPWTAAIEGETATWSGGSVEPGATGSFLLTLAAPARPGPAELAAEQRYPGGETVRWPVALTVTPGAPPREHVWRGVLVALLGLAATVGVVAFAWRRRSLQER
jgi:hypothetical protein